MVESSPFQSAIYEGRVVHRRLEPHRHEFEHRLFMVYLDLDELDRVFARRLLWSTRRPNLAWFRRADFFGDPDQPLAVSVRAHVRRTTGRHLRGPIRVLTHLRYFGYVMNPVTFYYCFAPGGAELECILAHVHNTPWGESHAYVLDRADSRTAGAGLRHRFGKAFHVSPFMDMEQMYQWQFSRPGETLAVHMSNTDARPGKDLESRTPLFDASLSLERRPMTGSTLARVLMRYPFMTAQVIVGIYWQAFRLWRRRTPFFPHPKHRPHPLESLS